MARLSQGILGGISGKIGNIVGSSWKGIAVIKTKPLSVANPQTTAQVAQRTKMSNIVLLSGQLLSGIIKPLWDRFASGMSGYNAFVRTNIDLFAAEVPSPAASLVISRGKMSAVAPTVPAIAAAAVNVEISFSAALPDAFSAVGDEVYAVAIGSVTGFLGISSAVTTRSDESAEIVFGSAVEEGETVSVYLAFRRADGTVVSNTGYGSTVVTA